MCDALPYASFCFVMKDFCMVAKSGSKGSRKVTLESAAGKSTHWLPLTMDAFG